MSDARHDLHSEFPHDGEILHALKLNDAHFRELADRYHQVARDIHRAETEIEPVSHEWLETLKKHRLALLDDFAALIATARRTG